MEIYLLGTRMFMIMEVNDSFSFATKAEADRQNPRVQEWEKPYVEIPAAIARGETGREVAADGKDLQVGNLTLRFL